MANEEQLSILRQGIPVWNNWRAKNLGVVIDLTNAPLDNAKLCGASLHSARLRGAKLRGADIRNAFLNNADLSGAMIYKSHLNRSHLIGARLRAVRLIESDLRETYLERTDFGNAFLRRVDLMTADLRYANLKGVSIESANFGRATLINVDLRNAILAEVDFRGSDLRGSDLNQAILKRVDFSRAIVDHTNFGSIDLTDTEGLDEVSHWGPSALGIELLVKAKGKLPDAFLRGCGLSDWEIEVAKLYNPDLSNIEIKTIQDRMRDMRSHRVLQISPLFISYSHGDSEFVNKLTICLTENGIRFWRDIHDMQAGRIEKQIDRAISEHRIVLLVLSENSLKSDWVQHEVRVARDTEKEFERDVLCPIALDESWESGRWPERIMEQIKEYKILDFSAWKDDKAFEEVFRKLLYGLDSYYKE